MEEEKKENIEEIKDDSKVEFPIAGFIIIGAIALIMVALVVVILVLRNQ